MVTSYLRFCAEPEMPMRPQNEEGSRHPTVEEVWEIDVIDMFGEFLLFS